MSVSGNPATEPLSTLWRPLHPEQEQLTDHWQWLKTSVHSGHGVQKAAVVLRPAIDTSQDG